MLNMRGYMTTKKTVSFDDMDGNTYELIIDSKKLPKGLYSAIRRTSKKKSAAYTCRRD